MFVQRKYEQDNDTQAYLQRKYERDNATQAYLQRKSERENAGYGNVTLSMVTVTLHFLRNRSPALPSCKELRSKKTLSISLLFMIFVCHVFNNIEGDIYEKLSDQDKTFCVSSVTEIYLFTKSRLIWSSNLHFRLNQFKFHLKFEFHESNAQDIKRPLWAYDIRALDGATRKGWLSIH